MKHSFIKKIASVLLALLIMVPAATVAAPQRAHALFGAGDIVVDPVNLVQNTITAVTSSKQLLAPIAWAISKATLQSIVASTVKWINSGFNGSPGYVTNLSNTLQTVADAQAQVYLNQFLNSSSIHSPFQNQVYQYVRNDYLRSSSNNSVLGQNSYTLGNYTSDANSFLSGQTTEGGLNAWFAAISNPANTPLGETELAQQELRNEVSQAESERMAELNWGQGVLSFRGKCNSSTSSGSTNLSSAEPCYGASIQTPGSVILANLNKVTGSGIDTLVSAKDFDEIVNALLSQLILHITGGSGSLRDLSQPSSSTGNTSYFDQTDPSQTTTTATITSDFSATISGQIAQFQKFETQWQTILTTAQAAKNALSAYGCSVNQITLTNIVQPVIDQATTEISNAQTALASLNTISNEMPTSSSNNSTTQISKVYSDYTTFLAAATTPSTSDITYAAEQSVDTGTSTPSSLFTKMNTIANNASSCQNYF